MPLMRMEHTTPAKEETVARIGDISGIEVLKAQVLVGIYQRPTRTKSGLYISDDTRKEDTYQGKVGLVLALGPDAFKDTDKLTFKRPVEVGEWVVLKVSDGWPLTINNKDGNCRMLDDVDIRAVVSEPDMVW